MRVRTSLLPFCVLVLAGLAVRELYDESADETPLSPTARGFAVSVDAGSRLEQARPEEAGLAPVASMESGADERRALPDERRFLRGRLVLPAGAPADPSLRVVLLGEALEGPVVANRSWDLRETIAAGQIDPEGRFELALEADAAERDLLFDVDGRFLHLHSPVEVPQGAEEEWVIEPELGGVLRGRLELPAGMSDVPRIHVTAYGTSYGGAGNMRSVEGGEAEDPLAFELRGLPADLAYTLSISTDLYPGHTLERPTRVHAGEVAEARVALEAGARVRGMVVDEEGAPLAGVEVSGDPGVAFAPLFHPRRVQTDAEGGFDLRGLWPRAQRLSASLEGHLEGESDELELREGEVVEDLRIVLGKGLALRGVVLGDDGRPVEGARLTLLPKESREGIWRFIEKARSEEGSGRSDEHGAFQFEGLGAGAFVLFAAFEHADARVWKARATAPAGSGDVTLRLQPPAPFTARVLDDAGSPVDTFSVAARRADWPAWVDDDSFHVEERFDSAAGSFTFDELDAGAWKISIVADAHLQSEVRTVEVPGTESEPFVLTRAARLVGRVLDPKGNPLEGAEVRVLALAPEGRSDSAVSDAEGRYELAGVGPGTVTVQALDNAWAPSAEARLELSSGEVREGYDVHVEGGGTLTGIVFDRDGAPDVGRLVVAQSEDWSVVETLSEEAGRFRFEHLAPGTVQVVAMPDPEASHADAGAGPEENEMGEMFEDMTLAVAEVVDGETAEVVLGAPPRDPVELAGLLLQGRQPVVGAQLMVLAENGAFLDGLRIDTSDDEGRFSFQLDEPGDYTFVAMIEGEGAGSRNEIDFQVHVPDVERHELELVLPGGAIRGRVLGPLGDGAGDGPGEGLVWLHREDATSELSALVRRNSVSIADDGSFAFELLHPGHYSVSATSVEAAMTTRHDIVVERDRATDIELNLKRAGEITGRVVDGEGSEVQGALLFLRDGRGRMLYELEVQSDYQGGFRIPRVPVGEVFVVARTEEGVSDGTPVQVEPGGDHAVEVVVRPGAFLRIAVADGEGRALRASVRLQGEAERAFGDWRSQDELQRLLTQGVSANERTLGPLPPGRYTLRASAAGGWTGELRVSLRAGEMSEERIRLKQAK